MYSTEDLEVEQYKQVLGAYKRLNSLISLEGATSREYMSKMTDDECYQTQQTDNELLSCLDSIPQTETSIHKACRWYLGEKSHKFEYNTNIEDRERALNTREKELNDREQKLSKRESGLKAFETQLSVRESQIRELVGRLEKAKKRVQSQLSIEPYEPICYVPPVKREERVYTFDNDIDSFSRENIEEVLRRVAELEETNVMLNERNTFLEEEIIRNTSDVNEQKYFLVREKEKLVNKENSLKCREQTLLNREHRLIENAKYINSTVKSVNQYIKSNAERDQGKCEVVNQNQNECKENNVDHLTFRGFLQSLDEIKDFSNLPEGENRIRR